MKTKLNVWLMMGLPCSGKSTYIESHFDDSVIISQDEIRKVFYGNQFFPNAENYVIGDAKNIARLMLAQCKSVVIDCTSILSSHRKEWKRLAEEFDANFTIVFCDTPVEVCIDLNRKRPEGKRVPDEVIMRMAEQMQRPVELMNMQKKTRWWDVNEEVSVILVERKQGE